MRGLVPLTKIKPGKEVTVAAIISKDAEIVKKAAVLGILAGEKVIVLQRKPVYVLKIGYAKIAIEQRIAEKIYIG